jgi:membrane protease YdiL (CAAX protease family)
MITFLKTELGGLWDFLKRNANETVIIAAAVLFISLDHYHTIGPNWLSVFLYYGVFPLLVIMVVLRKNPLDFGLRWGLPRLWGWYVLIICGVAGLILWASTSDSGLQGYYSQVGFNVFTYTLTQVLNLGGSEFLYRGFLLFGLKEKFGEGAILLQMIPFVMTHFGKPEIETVSTIITGILFGWVAYRGKSFWPVFIIHMFINVFFVALVNFRYPVSG